MAGQTITQFSWSLHEWFEQKKPENEALRKHPFLQLMRQNDKPNVVGRKIISPVIVNHTRGVSANFAKALANNKPAEGISFSLDTADLFKVITFSHKLLLASEGNLASFIDEKTLEMETAVEAMVDEIAAFSAGTGNNSKGAVLTNAAGAIVLADMNDIFKFHKGEVLQATTAGGVVRDTGNEITITGIQPEQGRFTYSGAIAGLVATDLLYSSGSYNASTFFQGFQAWIPAANPTTIFNGQDRTNYPTELGGCRLTAADIANKGNVERMRLLAARMAGRYGSKAPTDYIVGPQQWDYLAQSLETRREYKGDEKMGSLGFSALQLISAGSTINIWQDPNWSDSLAAAINRKYWTLYSIGKLIHPQQGDDKLFLRQGTTVDYEARYISYPALGCSAPLYQGTVPLVAPS